jgi:hypothetical protein
VIDRARESVRREPLLQGLRVLVGREMESAIAGPAGGRHGEGAIAGPVGSRHKERNRWGLQVVGTERERSLGPADGERERAIAGPGGRGSGEGDTGLEVVDPRESERERESNRWACRW